MAENTKPTLQELRAVTGVDLSVSQLPTLANFDGTELVHVVSGGMDYKMDASRFAAELAGSEVSMADLRTKADQSAVDTLSQELALLNLRKADKTQVDALTQSLAEVDASKVNRTAFVAVEGRVNALEVRSATIERKATDTDADVNALRIRVAAVETKANDTAIVAQKGVEDASRAQIKANTADGNAQSALDEVAVQRGRIDGQVLTIARMDNEVQANKSGLGEAKGGILVLQGRADATELATAQNTGRISALELEAPTYAKASALAVTQAGVTVNSQAISAVETKVAEHRILIDALGRAQDDLSIAMAAGDQGLQLQIDQLRLDYLALKARVDAIAVDGGLFPEVSVIGTVTQPNGYEGSNYSCSIVNTVTNSLGIPLMSLMFHLETRRMGGVWQNAKAVQFTEIDSGASVQLDVTVGTDELFEYRSVLKDKFRPGWSHVLREFAFLPE